MPRDENRRHHRSSSRFEKARGFDAGSQLSGSVSQLSTLNSQLGGAPARPPIHPLETALLIVVIAHLVFLPWALGAVRLWAQIPSLVLALISFVLALWPRRVEFSALSARPVDQSTSLTDIRRQMSEQSAVGPTAPPSDATSSGQPSHFSVSASQRVSVSDAAPGRALLLPHRKLLRFPIFWLGLALLTLIVVQGLNPAWEYQTNGKLWWMRRMMHIEWLPHGVTGVPFNPAPLLPQGGEWRLLLMYAPAWLTVCSIWIGFTRRRTLQRFLIALAANGVALALFGIAQRVLGWTEIFNFVPSTNPSFFASFIYKNHAGGYLLLMIAIATGLGAWYYARSVRRLDKSSPAGLFGFFVTCIAAAMLISYARGATLTMLGYLCVVVVAFLWFQARLPKVARSPIITVAMLLVFAFFVRTGLVALNTGLAWDRLRQAVSGHDLSVEARMTANRASAQMLSDHWGLGTGSGSFPFLFPLYQQHQPLIAKHQFWPHAHNDILELAIDFGLPGVLLIGAGFAFWFLALVRSYAWENPLTAATLTGALALVAMSWGDFVFFCPAILTTWCALWPACTRWAELEEARGSA